jgi:hypothetical protein
VWFGPQRSALVMSAPVVASAVANPRPKALGCDGVLCPTLEPPPRPAGEAKAVDPPTEAIKLADVRIAAAQAAAVVLMVNTSVVDRPGRGLQPRPGHCFTNANAGFSCLQSAGTIAVAGVLERRRVRVEMRTPHSVL